MSNSIRNPQSAIRNAFTLVELLVVIGIIIALLGILLPVVSSARRAAYATATTNQIKNIGNAIDRYFQEFNAYPGLFSNSDINAGVTISNASGTVTSTENCVFSLVGGITAKGTGPTYNDPPYTNPTVAGYFALKDIGRGPLTFNAVQQKRYPPFMDVSPQTFSVQGSSLDENESFNTGAGQAGVTLNFTLNPPEFIDQFPGAMPIVYLRANPGALNNDQTSATPQYNLTQSQPYFTATTDLKVPNPINGPFVAFPSSVFPATGALTAGVEVYFGNASLSATVKTAKRKDTYMLISPGKDRIYGTADDICNFDVQ